MIEYPNSKHKVISMKNCIFQNKKISHLQQGIKLKLNLKIAETFTKVSCWNELCKVIELGGNIILQKLIINLKLLLNKLSL